MSESEIDSWLESIGWSNYTIEIASSDASFRQYYRVIKEKKSFILMDSSLQIETLTPFIDINLRLSNAGVHIPEIIHQNLEKGYLILEDLGSQHYFDILNTTNYKELYQKAIDEIISMQKADITDIPLYDREFLIWEMDLMQEWYLEGYLKKDLNLNEKSIISKTIDNIADIVLTQPSGVFVHRDFHSRNIMVTPDNDIAVIDFQDARVGAITYDLVSLLKDAYIEFDPIEIEKLALYYKDKKKIKVDDAIFIKWFDFMGLQRHIKVLGIFARLYIRDQKDNYLKDIPLVKKYILETAIKYEETKGLVEVLR
ncbi:MAG: phosphotransferase [Sulfurovum sp.]